jgi:hypothetical protein
MEPAVDAVDDQVDALSNPITPPAATFRRTASKQLSATPDPERKKPTLISDYFMRDLDFQCLDIPHRHASRALAWMRWSD